MGNENAKPIKKYQAGAVNLAVWKNTLAPDADGRENVMYSVTLERRYKDRAGAWQSTSSFHTNDIPKAALLLQKAYEFMTLDAQENASNGNGGDHA